MRNRVLRGTLIRSIVRNRSLVTSGLLLKQSADRFSFQSLPSSYLVVVFVKSSFAATLRSFVARQFVMIQLRKRALLGTRRYSIFD